MEKKREIGLSKFLSLLLRHNPGLIGLILDDKGWADVNELIGKSALKGKKFNLEDIKYIVKNCDKQRYSFNDDFSKIRANQGHSIMVDLELIPTEPPEILFHGTAIKNLKSILENGIHSGTRNYVHLSQDIETATKVGMRHGKVVLLKIMSGKMFNKGINFYLSKNNVWLTDFIEPKYIEPPNI
ncbi:MAG: RNA 2'-phosphotransferase [Bacteroidales bacterium]|nr:RNA 2'-phosphotransferase [Bacteroidales bacterium]